MEKILREKDLNAIKDAIDWIHYIKSDFLETSDDYKNCIENIDSLNKILIKNGREKYRS